MRLHPTDFLRTLSHPSSKVRRNPFQHPFSLKIKAPVLITQSGIIDIIGTFNNVKMPKMPHVIFIFCVRFLRFSVFSRIVQCEEELAIVKEGVSVLTHPLVLCS